MKAWTTGDDRFLRDNYTEKGVFHCAQILERGQQATRQRAYLLNITSNNRWDADEDAFLRENYALCTNDELAMALTRTPGAIKDRARRLGISTKTVRPWSPNEHQFLLENHGKLTNEEIAEKLSRTKNAVVMRAYEYVKSSRRKMDITADDLPAATHYNPFLTGRIGGKPNV